MDEHSPTAEHGLMLELVHVTAALMDVVLIAMAQMKNLNPALAQQMLDAVETHPLGDQPNRFLVGMLGRLKDALREGHVDLNSGSVASPNEVPDRLRAVLTLVVSNDQSRRPSPE